MGVRPSSGVEGVGVVDDVAAGVDAVDVDEEPHEAIAMHDALSRAVQVEREGMRALYGL